MGSLTATNGVFAGAGNTNFIGDAGTALNGVGLTNGNLSASGSVAAATLKTSGNGSVGGLLAVGKATPAYYLDVGGSGSFSSYIKSDNTSDATGYQTGAVWANGGISSGKQMWVGSNAMVCGYLTTTNGVVHPYLAAIPTNSIPQWTGTSTNWWVGNVGGTLYAIATNIDAGGFIQKQLAP